MVKRVQKIVIVWFKEICNINLNKDLHSEDLPFSLDLAVNFRTLDNAIDKKNIKLTIQHVLHYFQRQAELLGRSFETAKESN